MELLDTSALIDCFTGRRASLPRLVTLLEGGARLGMTSLTLYEWRRGDRRARSRWTSPSPPTAATSPTSPASAWSSRSVA